MHCATSLTASHPTTFHRSLILRLGLLRLVGNALLLVEKTRVMHSMRQHNHTMDHLNDASNISDSLDDSVATTERMMAR